jgi:uncharacterized cupin superfamily protein
MWLRLAIAALLGAALSACGGAASPGPVPSVSPTPIPGAVVVTRANDRGTVYARIGDTIQVALGTEYEWRVDPPDGVVLVRADQNVRLARGTQAVFRAAAAGTTKISATGTVICPSGQACIMIAILFTTTTVVVAP